MDLKLILISFVLLSLAFAGIAIKIWSKKDGKFAGTCASQNPYLNKNGDACGILLLIYFYQKSDKAKNPSRKAI